MNPLPFPSLEFHWAFVPAPAPPRPRFQAFNFAITTRQMQSHNKTFNYDIKDSAIIDDNKIVYQTLDKLYFINSTLD